MEAIKVTRQNLAYVTNNVIAPAPWAADFENTFESNLANNEWTYVYTKTRGTGANVKTSYHHATATKFNETFKFTTDESPYALTTITVK